MTRQWESAWGAPTLPVFVVIVVTRIASRGSDDFAPWRVVRAAA